MKGAYTMNEEKRQLLLGFIDLYHKAIDKEEFMYMWENFLEVPESNEPLTLKEAYESAHSYMQMQLGGE